MTEELIHIDLFSGVGGFSYGFEQSKMKVTKQYFSEIDKHAIAVYKYHFKNAEYVGSVIDVSGTAIRERHPNAKFIITFGFPCQDLSVAGKGLGFDGKRSVLFFEAMRIVNEVQPEVFVFENVKGLLTHNGGETFEIILRTIADLGIYDCEWQLLNTRWLLPQNRERIYFVGHLTGASRPELFPFTKADFRTIEGKSNSTTVRTITAGGHSGGHHSGMTLIDASHRNEGLRTYRDVALTLNARDYKEPRYVCKPVLTPDRKEKRQNGRRFKENGEPAFTLNTQDMHGVQIDNTIRRLTEIECERLQGFPDNWTKYGNYDGIIKEVSRTQRYKQMGNAITSLWATHIANRLDFQHTKT